MNCTTTNISIEIHRLHELLKFASTKNTEKATRAQIIFRAETTIDIEGDK